jgi:hypothetical protein
MRYLCIAVVSCLLTSHAQAAIEQQLAHCATIADNASRLQCYDQLAQASDHVAVSAVAETNAKTSPNPALTPKLATAPSLTVNPQTSVKADAVAEFGAPRKEDNQALEQIRYPVTSAQKGLRGGYTVTLANGQVWQQIGSESFRVKQGQTVVIEKAALGSFLMHVDGTNNSIRVKRLQ